MRASIRDHGDEIRLVVENLDAATAPLLHAQLRTEADGRFEKRFWHDALLFPHDDAFEPEAWVDGRGVVDFEPCAERRLEEVAWRGRTLRVPELSTHLWPNEARGRLDREALIRARVRPGQGE